SLDGALASLTDRVATVAAHVDTERAFAASLRRAAEERYAAAVTDVGDAMADGALLRSEVLGRWQELVGSGQLLRGLESRVAAVRDEVRAWQGGVLELVAEQSGSKRTTARILSYGVNGAGVALMILVFAQTGGLTGIEIAVAGGTATVSQKVLEALFGDQAVR